MKIKELYIYFHVHATRHVKTLLLLAALLLGMALPTRAQGDYDMNSGFYYLENKQNNEGYFLVPAGGSGTMKYFNDDANTPYLTTYKKSRESTDEAINNFIWYVEKVSTGIYRLRHMLTGRYVVINGVVDGSNPARRRFHLETQQVPDDNTQFLFFAQGTTIGIRHASVYATNTDGKEYWWMDVSGGNKDNYSQNDYNGLMGLWELIGAEAGRQKWAQPAAIESIKKVCLPPVISYNSSTQEVTISSYEGATDVDFYYTTDGTTPTTSSTHYTDPFPLATGTVKAIAVRDNTFQNPTVTSYNTQQCAPPTITFNSTTGNYDLSCTTVGDITYYYTTDGSTPTRSSSSTTASITLPLDTDAEILRVVAALTSGDETDVSVPASVSIPLCEAPTISYNSSTAQIEMSCATANATIRYNNNGNVPTSTSGTVYSTPIQKTINDAPSTYTARAFRLGYRPSSATTYNYPKLSTPKITGVNADGSLTLTPAGATFRYTTSTTATPPSDPASGSPELVTNNTALLPAGTTITIVKVRGYKLGNGYSDVLTYYVPTLQEPTISESGGTITISGEADATIYYTTDGSDPTTSSSQYSAPFAKGGATVIRAYASKVGYHDSPIATLQDAVVVSSTDDITSMIGNYKLAADFTINGSIGTAAAPFRGTIDGQNNRIASSSYPLVAYAQDAKIKNILLTTATVSGDTVGAICNIATGYTRIYNCGLQGGTVTGTGTGTTIAGGLVGFIDGNARVINCYSYANVSGGTYAAGIVGYNNFATTSTLASLKTMVMNCMFYGNITGGNSIAAIYNGELITNRGDQNGVGNYNYFRLEAPFVQPTGIAYNCALGAEDRFLQRFEFYRHLLNSHRELAGWWVTGNYDKEPMYKWVLSPDSIGTAHPYPILMPFDKYPSVVNYDAEHASTGKPRNQGGKLGTLTVNIQMGNGAVYNHPGTGDNEAKITTSQLTLNITDKDTAHFNFNYYKVQLPYYNDVGTKNYNGNRVVTGWKIVSITGGTAGTYSTGEDVIYDGSGNLTTTPYNFADRNCTNKDLYSVSGRVFNQGAYWDVPYGVTAITIEPYWAKCVYLADQNADKVYSKDMKTEYNVSNVGGGQIYTNGNSYSIAGDNQIIYTSMSNAIASSGSALFSDYTDAQRNSHSVYDYAVVLVGNYHYYGALEASNSKPFTVTSIDLDGDNEPDYSYILRFDGRTVVHPVKVDFINIPGLGMAQKSTGGTGSYNFGIMQPKGWFESTNTSLFRVTQFEYDRSDRGATPYIVQGGVIEQWVSGQNNGAANNTTYYHVGGNVWFKEFHRGTHQDKTLQSKHPPVSVTGGDYDEFYLTGLYTANVTSYADNAECYINGGRFGTVCGAAMEGIGKADGADNTGNITWQIQNADIHEFYAGGLNAAKPVTGNLSTTIIGSHVDIFCGGPKFGDMSANKTVVTNATGCTFGTFFGAGYGGNSYSRQAPRNHNNITNFPHNDKEAGNHSSWNNWLAAYYTQTYNSTYGGVSTRFSYQFLPMSGNADNVARIFVEYVKFSLATTHSVTSTLKHCTVTGNFYGGGSLGKVDGTVTSILDSCIVKGNVFGAGYSALLPPVEVDSIGFRTEPYYYTELGTYRTGVKGQTTTYHWRQGNAISIDKDHDTLYTTEDLNALGTVQGNVTLTLKGNTTVGTQNDATTGNVYGGGDMSGVLQQINNGNPVANTGNTQVILEEGATVLGNVYGGGNNGTVGGSSEVKIQDQ